MLDILIFIIVALVFGLPVAIGAALLIYGTLILANCLID